MPALPIELPADAIAAFCRKWKIARLEVFGSALREDFRADSDVDFLATFAPDNQWSLFDHVSMEEELKSLLGRDVDLVSRGAVEHGHNPYRKKSILESAHAIYSQS
jgi:uncharacterized protein